ncbi:uncharacterized protein LOC116402814 isoform X1 [Cucumis sativus]|uniref:uncharacterized protein LOC116402814 isoform X1 n=1 Tax=Cucumis sativus TaxID=3659 RepID=UPI0012F49C18|nr:uncharacterized protein LOC116402814 isoform X1 [Cucumis sativus]
MSLEEVIGYIASDELIKTILKKKCSKIEKEISRGNLWKLIRDFDLHGITTLGICHLSCLLISNFFSWGLWATLVDSFLADLDELSDEDKFQYCGIPKYGQLDHGTDNEVLCNSFFYTFQFVLTNGESYKGILCHVPHSIMMGTSFQ